jgi:hypothetical protein
MRFNGHRSARAGTSGYERGAMGLKDYPAKLVEVHSRTRPFIVQTRRGGDA